jgi:CopG family nickel-responsive transcriptional regulator
VALDATYVGKYDRVLRWRHLPSPPRRPAVVTEALNGASARSRCRARRLGGWTVRTEERSMSELTRTALAIDTDLLAKFDRWMADRGYTSRSEAVRDLIRSALVEAEWQSPTARVVAVLTVIYDHAARDLAQELTEIQHGDHHAILCSQHVHLDDHQCLEAIVMRGPARQLRRLGDTIASTHGVKAGKLTILSQNV